MATVDISNDDELKSEKIIYKRRSSIFHTRIIASEQDKDDNTITDRVDKCIPNKEEECNIQKNDAFNLEQYIKKLKQERKDWQQEYKNRKIQRKNLTKKKMSMEKQGQVLDINILTERERVFLLTRPNYEHISRNSQKLMDVAMKISTLSQLVHKLNQRFTERMENNISKATNNVIKMSNNGMDTL